MPLKVAKSDGGTEVYLHTKVMGSVSAALGDSGSFQEGLTEHLSEAVTGYISSRHDATIISTDEIHAMIEVALGETGYYDAAMALHEHRLTRQIKRCRTEVIYTFSHDEQDRQTTLLELTTRERLKNDYTTQPWNKSVIVRSLENKYGLSHPLARAVAGGVEEKILIMGCRRVLVSLVRTMVANELWAMRRAEISMLEKLKEQPVESADCYIH